MKKSTIVFVILLTLISIGIYSYFEKELTNAKEEIILLKNSVKANDIRIVDLKDEIEDNLEEIKEGENLIQKLNTEIEKLKDNSNSKDDEISDLNIEIKNLKEELSEYDNLRQLDVVATAYTSGCNGCIGITKTGHDVRNTVYRDGMRVIATDPNVIPLGSIVHVESDDMSFIGIASDTGGAIKNRKIDILVNNKNTAYQYGRQDAKVTILKEGSSG